MSYHYMTGGVVTNTDAVFCGIVALANFVYLALPMVFPELAAILVGADMSSATSKAGKFSA
jgi:hypothetical protein